MNSIVKSGAFILMLCLVMVVAQVHVAAASAKRVVVENDIDGEDIGVHCASADDDLGFVPIHPRGQWGFSFHTRLVGKTLFHCRISLRDSSHGLDVYDDNIHRYVCDTCHWSIRSNGSCLFSSDIRKVDCYDWVN
ncbi:hypothetical protein MLD38_036184 [Melastoma candidum]|uniref:Uncharacterized protein n=1 Tax=Melastoma candidum TaxID=119954 RepID=A0ACB9LJG7_9MYRT|nr:hypothetical protein MLD38_036184 [Melastoma candidum]